ncbi:hypothetical protein [Cyanobium sp. ATX-6F1]|uniref:hypothetical protein n=1 Tax=Cyanobium sp. ATX-6F1 TaxID=3137388 RepID=UPI0039BEB460
MLRFYTDVLGCSFTKRNERLGMIHLRAGKSQIDLVDADGALGLAGGAPWQGGPQCRSHLPSYRTI